METINCTRRKGGKKGIRSICLTDVIFAFEQVTLEFRKRNMEQRYVSTPTWIFGKWPQYLDIKR